MNKKGLKEKIENVPKNKYIYQRYNGLITKYIDKGDYYIDCNTGIAIEKNEHLLLGKVSENIIDLIEVGDFVNGYQVYLEEGELAYELSEHMPPYEFIKNIKIETVLTHQQFEANCYKVGGEE